MNAYVTERELNRALEPIQDDIGEIKRDVRALVTASNERRGVSKFVKSIGGGITVLALVVSAGWWIPALLH